MRARLEAEPEWRPRPFLKAVRSALNGRWSVCAIRGCAGNVAGLSTYCQRHTDEVLAGLPSPELLTHRSQRAAAEGRRNRR